jgi:predicted esterase
VHSIVGFIAMTLVAAACVSTSSSTVGQAAQVDRPSEATPTEPTVVSSTTEAAISPGGLSLGQVEIDGTALDYVIVVPAGFELGDTAPVLLALPPGGQDLALTQSIVNGVYQTEALARGWVVVSPAAPNGELFFRGSEALISGFIQWMTGWVDAEGGAPHLSGISNGGISAFRVLAENPTAFRSVLVFPGFPQSETDKAALTTISGVPIRMFVGETDESWATSMEEAFRTLADAGVDVTLEVVAGQDHFILSMTDGVRVFDELDALR